jgi:SPP1 gp7 family putative phage head morphogenesis protein
MPQILDVGEELRRQLAASDRRAQAYIRDGLAQVLAAAQGESKRYADQLAGGKVTNHALFQDARFRLLTSQLSESVASASRGLANSTATLLDDMIRSTHDVMDRHVRSIANGTDVSVPWNPVSVEAFTLMSGFTADGSPLQKIFERASAAGASSARDALRAGVVMGLSSTNTAKNVRKALNISAYRSHLIARTELHRTAREVQRATMSANAHLYEGWTWRAATDSTTCVICWALHGRFFPITYGEKDTTFTGMLNASSIPQPPSPWAARPFVPEMLSHPNCRCALVPRPRSFAEILGDPTIPDDRDVLPPQDGLSAGERAFTSLPEATKLAILGPARYAHYKQDPNLTQFLMVRPDPVWGDTMVLRPLCRC